MEQNTKEEAKKPRIIGTAHLLSGKEVRFVFDELVPGKNGTNFSLNGELVAYVPSNTPVIYNKHFDSAEIAEKLERAFKKAFEK